MSGAPYVVGLPRHHLADRLALGSLQLLALALDPGESMDDCQSHLVVVECCWRSNSYSPHRWVYADVQVLDLLVDDVDVDARDAEVGASGTHGVPSPVQTVRSEEPRLNSSH